MLATADEVCIWKDLGEKLLDFLSDIDNGRDEAQILPWEDTPEFDRLQLDTYRVYLSIEGRIQELEPNYYGRSVNTPEDVRRFHEALSYGINYVGLFRYWYSSDFEFEALLNYIVSHGLASMNYKATYDAVSKYDDEKYEELLKRRTQKNEAL